MKQDPVYKERKFYITLKTLNSDPTKIFLYISYT
jgi:hypothetical protein